MGKIQEDQSPTSPPEAGEPERIAGDEYRIGRLIGLRCVAALAFGVAVLLSAIFWLPPFPKGGHRGESDFRNGFAGRIVASFELQKPASLLSENILRLEYDIYEEIGVANSMVIVTSLEPLAGSNWTNVVFEVLPVVKSSAISSAGISIMKASFVSLVSRLTTLHLSPSLFGNASFFEVVKFPGGITVIPQQSGFPLQNVQTLFSFTLKFSVYQIQEIFDQLKSQLGSGLHLSSRENLYIRLTNVYGSTLAPPVVVQSSVLLAVGNRPPPLPRLKQLAQAITGSSAKNLGLNHTVFGKVNQIQLSSTLNRSLDSGGTGSSTSWTPTPGPLPDPSWQHHHRHHRQQSYPPDVHIDSAPAPTPQHWDRSSSRPGCQYRNSRKPKPYPHLAPIVAPPNSQRPSTAPYQHGDPPTPIKLPSHRHTPPVPSPLPAVIFARVEPPIKTVPHMEPPNGHMPVLLPPSFSFSGGLSTAMRLHWALPLLICLLIHV